MEERVDLFRVHATDIKELKREKGPDSGGILAEKVAQGSRMV